MVVGVRYLTTSEFLSIPISENTSFPGFGVKHGHYSRNIDKKQVEEKKAQIKFADKDSNLECKILPAVDHNSNYQFRAEKVGYLHPPCAATMMVALVRL